MKISKAATSTTAAPGGTKPLLSGPKRQHYLPQFYLENFSMNGLVAVYDREQDTVRLQQPINTGVIGHLYTMVDADGRKRFELEQLLSEYEGKAKPAIDKLALQEDLSADERSDLAIFVALAAMRTPDVIDSLKAFNSDMVTDVVKRMFNDADDVAMWLRERPDCTDKPAHELRDEAELMIELAQNDGVHVSTSHRWAVSMAFQMALEIAPIFAGRNWVVAHSNNLKKSFITTDAPVFLTTTEPRTDRFWGVGYGNTDALVFFPLNKSCVLAMQGEGGDIVHIDVGAGSIRQLNLAMASQCKRFVVGRDEALLNSLAQHARLAQTKWQPKMQLA